MLAAMPPTPATSANQGEPPVRERGDACPGALRLHPADDGGLARLRLPGGLLTSRQVEALAAAAQRLGDGHIGVTSRGNVELRGLGEGCGAGLAELLDGAGLLPSRTHERVRNVVASPLAGLDEVGAGAPRLWVRELDALLCGAAWAAGLSGRFLFALDDGRGDVAGLGADVTLIAEGAGGARGAEGAEGTAAASAVVRLPGHRGVRVAAADAPRAALAAARAFLDVAGSGAWRVRELPDGVRVDVAGALARAGVPGRAVPDVPAVRSGGPAPGLVRAPEGTAALCVLAPLGRLTADQWRALLPAPADEVRVTPWRGFVVPGFADADAARTRLRALADAGFVTAPDHPLLGVSACTGRPGCAKSLADVRADVVPAAGALPVHWSGCARRCGRPHGDRVDVLAVGDGRYEVTVRTGDGDAAVPVPLGASLTETVATARTAIDTRTAEISTLTR
ncbi:cobalamin biosynthesis protein CobG [Streptomyces sp. NPDC050504]|uniref:cobalamin biosynthesis protein CobG n=1 Tax=Streptomyces sp. NPDC050504 TaxID=3365618 RepID=UPI0037975B16